MSQGYSASGTMNCDREERDEAEREDAGGVGHCDDPTQEKRVERSAPCADEIAGHDRLAMPRRECVRGPQKAAIRSETSDDAERRDRRGR